jgi:hypothetical protein
VLVGLVIALSARINSFFLRLHGVNLRVKLVNSSLSDLFVGEGGKAGLIRVFFMQGSEGRPSEVESSFTDCDFLLVGETGRAVQMWSLVVVETKLVFKF